MRRLGLLLLVGLSSIAGCSHEEAAPTRPSGPSLGEDIFGVLCDRVGAQSLREDLSGGSYTAICHGSASTVDQSKLPPAPDANVRTLAVAKIEALARHKVDIITALDTVFPDDIVVGKNLDAADPVASCDPVSSKTRREQLRGLLQRILPKEDDDLVPESSRAVARSIEPLTTEEGQGARISMTRLAARRGYMPPELSTGLLASVLTAPRLRDLLGTTMTNLGPDADPYDKPGTRGKGYGAFKQFIGAVQADMLEPVAQEKPLTTTTDAAGRPILSRPRTTLELARAVLLYENPVFSNGGDPLFVVKRDPRGMAVVKKEDGKLPSPFVDRDDDGLPDLDSLGRFVGGGPDPFEGIGSKKDPTYEYVDARNTALNAVVRHLAPLADPDNGKESIMNMAEGIEPALKDGGREALLDLVHAAGNISADPGTDGALALFGQLFTEQPELMARITGNLLDMKAVLDAHPEAKIPEGSTLVDDLLDVTIRLAAEPGLLEDVLTSLGDPRGQYIKEAIPAMMLHRDQITYDPNALNGLPRNLTTGGGPPETLVDRNKPNVGWNRSIFQRFLQLLQDTNGVTFCNKKDARLHGYIKAPTGVYIPIDLPTQIGADTIGDPAPECTMLKIDNLSVFYLQSMVGRAKLVLRPVLFTDPAKPALLTPKSMEMSTGITGFWDSAKGNPDGRDEDYAYPRPEFLNRLVFYKVDEAMDCSDESGNKNKTNCVIKDLQGAHMPSSACKERTIDDPFHVSPPGSALTPADAIDPSPDKKIKGLRTCQPGENLDERVPDTLFALEYNHGYDAFAPLAEVFVKHKKEQGLVNLMVALNKSWSVQGGIANAEPALAEILKGDLIPSLGELAKVTNKMKVERCIASGNDECAKHESVPAVTVLAEGIRALVDPERAKAAGVTDRRGKTTTKSGRPISIVGLVRDSINDLDAVLGKDKTREHKYLTARSNIVDEFLWIDGRGEAAKFKDPGIPHVAPGLIRLLRAQRLAKCKGDAACPELRKQLSIDVEETMKGKVFTSAIDLLDAVLYDKPMRGEIGRMTSYMFRDDGKLGGDTSASASSTPFGGSKKGPGVLDQSVAALVDALGAMGDLSELRRMYPFLSKALDDIDPQLSLLSRLNARAYDANGNEICAKELDPEEAIRNSLSRLSLPVNVPGKPTRPALQILLDAIADVNRVDGSVEGPLEPDDYMNVFKNVHELLTDPQGGLEQLYASVKNATQR